MRFVHDKLCFLFFSVQTSCWKMQNYKLLFPKCCAIDINEEMTDCICKYIHLYLFGKLKSQHLLLESAGELEAVFKAMCRMGNTDTGKCDFMNCMHTAQNDEPVLYFTFQSAASIL